MRRLFSMLATGAILCSAQAAEPENISLEAPETQEVQSTQAKAPSDDVNGYNKWRIGSYGEMLATFKDYGLNRYYGSSKGNTKKNHNEISIPRFRAARPSRT